MALAALAALSACGSLKPPPEAVAAGAPPDASSAPLSTAAPVRAALSARPPAAAASLEDKRRGYARYIMRTYRVRRDLADEITKSACAAGARFKLPPALLLAVMAVESSYDPWAFNGTDVGLMQVNPRSHPEKVARVGGAAALYDVDKNIFVGAWALREWRDRSPSMAKALRGYSGSRRASASYPQRVEAQRLALESSYRPRRDGEPARTLALDQTRR